MVLHKVFLLTLLITLRTLLFHMQKRWASTLDVNDEQLKFLKLGQNIKSSLLDDISNAVVLILLYFYLIIILMNFITVKQYRHLGGFSSALLGVLSYYNTTERVSSSTVLRAFLLCHISCFPHYFIAINSFIFGQ